MKSLPVLVGRGITAAPYNEYATARHFPACDEEQLDHLDMAILASACITGGVETVSD